MGYPTSVVVTAGVSLLLGSAIAAWLARRAADDAPRAGNAWARGSHVVALFGHAAAGRVFIVTGASSGLGLEAARLLLRAGGRVVMAVRDVPAGERAAAALVAEAPPGAIARVMHLDLGSLQSVRAFAAAFMAGGEHWDGLINNAGVFGVAGVTADGFQTTWQTNCLAPALLTDLLLPAASADARVVNVSSKLYRLAASGGIAACCPPAARGDTYPAYGLSKACQLLHAADLNTRFAGTGRRAFAVEPGLVATRIMRESPPLVRALNYALLTPILKDADQGTASTLLCLLAPLLRLEGGCYVADCAAQAPAGTCGSAWEREALRAIFLKAWGTSSAALMRG